ncbi:oxidoreductase [Ramlibacter sp. USB13]|uniref:Oxidoreductase n=1 Tax=Ramlibacter cellulosilyticus TaxID=2764187 RepID=A0A923MLQ9_9BURK|nr:PDR/VanB family oxidoreductase [Ramlibacter cellulosilyticus]MBC5781463.1 oxidoreductase [Ramlibacter cellulosilyticus]
MGEALLKARVHALRIEARDVISVELQPAEAGASLPAFEPGSHIDLHLANGLVRSYSLLNGANDRRYVIGVLKARDSRGGSRQVHEQLRLGTELQISAPRNNFRLVEDAPRSVLVAGGIGVTPLLAMLRRLASLGRSVEFLHCARSRADAAFLEEVEAIAAQHPHVELRHHFDDAQGGPPDLRKLLAGKPADTHFYCCGPAPMLTAFEAACADLGQQNVHLERFSPVEQAPSTATGTCSVELRRSGRVIEVVPDVSILDAVLAAGVNPDHSCREGMCGACETRVLCGDVEHRDSILTKQEQAANKSMMICVSRGRSPTLVLDL